MTFLGTEAGGCGGAVEGKDVGPEIWKKYVFIYCRNAKFFL